MAESSKRTEGRATDEQARQQASRQGPTETQEDGMSHPVATGVGALGGAAAGAAAGMVGGPVGSVAGAVAGAVLGGLGANAVADAIDPAAEDQYWSDNYQSEPYYQAGLSYDDYAPAYQLGLQGRTQYSGRFDEVQDRLAQDWERQRGRSGLTWNDAREPSRAAWERVDQQLRAKGFSDDLDRSYSDQSRSDKGSSYTTSTQSAGGSYLGSSETDTTGNIRPRSGSVGSAEAMDSDDVVDVLNDLLECCRDGEYGFNLSAEHVQSSNLKERLTTHAQECRRAAEELMQSIRQLGGEPDEGGSTSGAMHRGWVSVKGSLAGYSDLAMLEECERGEDAALGRYRRALKEEDLPTNVRSLVQRQFDGVQRNHDEIKRLRDSLKQS